MEVKVTWNQVEEFVKELAKTDCQFYGVYGAPRGGLVLAVMVSHAMHIPLLLAPLQRLLNR